MQKKGMTVKESYPNRVVGKFFVNIWTLFIFSQLPFGNFLMASYQWLLGKYQKLALFEKNISPSHGNFYQKNRYLQNHVSGITLWICFFSFVWWSVLPSACNTVYQKWLIHFFYFWIKLESHKVRKCTKLHFW